MFYVIAHDGNRYGPADVATLNQWIREGRLAPTSMLEDASTGDRRPASEIPGLYFGPTMSPPQEGPSQPYGNPYGGTSPGPQQNPYQSPYQNPYQSPYQQPYRGADNGSSEVTAAWVLGAIGIFFCPVFLSTIGIVLAINAKNKGNPSGQAAMIFCIVSLIVGLAFGVLYAVTMMNNPRSPF
jgi:hypothetical protein